MKHLPRRWLVLLHCLYVCIDIAALSFIGYAHISHASHTFINHWGITNLVAIVIGIHLLYGLTVYWWLQKKYFWQATIISQILFNMAFVTIIQASNYNNLAYRLARIATVGLSAGLGAYVVMAEVAANLALNFLILIGIAKSSSYSLGIEVLFTLGAALCGFVGWLIFRRFFSEQSNSKLGALEQRLRQEQSQSSVIVESIGDGVIVFDQDGKISYINPAAAQFTQWTKEEAVGLDIRTVMKLSQENDKPLPEGYDIFHEVLTKNHPLNHIFVLTGQQKVSMTISLAVSPITKDTNRDVIGAVVVFRDVTEERQEEQQRAEFISTASHEMRTPVAAIEGYLALALNNKVSTIDTKARGYLEKAHESTQHLGKLFQDLLTSAKAEDGRLSNHPVVVEMGDFLERLTDSFKFGADKKHLVLDFLVGSNEVIDATKSAGGNRVVRPLYYVYVDPDRIREVITNLFDNAVKYTDQGKISIGLTGNNEVIQLFIRDTGPGIPPEDIPHLFQKFYRVDSTATRTVGGTGLGLFISRKIIELYNGQIWVESKMNEGSTFFINIPRLTTQRAEQLQASQKNLGVLQPINSLATP